MHNAVIRPFLRMAWPMRTIKAETQKAPESYMNENTAPPQFVMSGKLITGSDCSMLASQKSDPLVSICIPTYNAEKTTGRTIQSIIDQTYLNLEIIICDNSSTDNTLKIVNDFDDRRISIYSNETNIGAENNWSRCIEIAHGKYIAIYHSDDLYHPTIVEEQLRVLENNPQVGAVFTNAYHIDENGKVCGHGKLPFKSSEDEVSIGYSFDKIFSLILRYGNFLICPSVMVRADIYKKLAPFHYDQFKTSADLDMWLRISKRSQISIINKPLMSYRISRNQGGFAYQYLRTDEANFIKVVDFYLACCADNLRVPEYGLRYYELYKSSDKFFRSMNFLIKGDSVNAERILKDVLFSNFKNLSNLDHLHLVLKALLALIMVYAGLGKYAAGIYRHIKYGN
jgi:glycosyltransferase involved in cell wall biosynthesis